MLLSLGSCWPIIQLHTSTFMFRTTSLRSKPNKGRPWRRIRTRSPLRRKQATTYYRASLAIASRAGKLSIERKYIYFLTQSIREIFLDLTKMFIIVTVQQRSSSPSHFTSDRLINMLIDWLYTRLRT